MLLSATPGASPTTDGHRHAAAAAANSLKDTIGRRGLQLSLRWQSLAGLVVMDDSEGWGWMTVRGGDG